MTTEQKQEYKIEYYSKKIRDIKAEISEVVIGQEEMVNSMIYTLLSKGHVLLEGVPGLAKSLAVETFARVIGGNFKRFQFTPDKMPGDITGTMIFNEQTKEFIYHYGPIFCNIFLADEINRASPKVQSALLQAMQEQEVAVEGETYQLPKPFIVLATQNPIEQIGTYPLAESQVDRFMVKYDVGYPKKDEEAELLCRKNVDFETLKANVRKVLKIEDILTIQELIHDHVSVSRKVMEYILNVCITTRPPETYSPMYSQDHPDHPPQFSNQALRPRSGQAYEFHQYIRLGASPRATESLLAISKSFAFCQGRDFVNFDDVNICAAHVLRHRILLNSHAISKQINSDKIVRDILKTIRPY